MLNQQLAPQNAGSCQRSTGRLNVKVQLTVQQVQQQVCQQMGSQTSIL